MTMVARKVPRRPGTSRISKTVPGRFAAAHRPNAGDDLKPGNVQIVPSLLAADMGRLTEAVETVRAAGVKWVSIDVMDGHFVGNLSFGPEHVRVVKKAGPVFVDAHLMVEEPEKMAPWFVEAGADIVTVHLETCKDPRRVLRDLRRRGVLAGLAIKPKTPVEPLIDLLDDMDLGLVMTVEPGFGGAKFLPEAMAKVRAVREAIDAKGLACWVQVDGGINLETIAVAAEAGSDSLVAGSAIFGASDPAAAVRALAAQAQNSFKPQRKI